MELQHFEVAVEANVVLPDSEQEVVPLRCEVAADSIDVDFVPHASPEALRHLEAEDDMAVHSLPFSAVDVLLKKKVKEDVGKPFHMKYARARMRKAREPYLQELLASGRRGR